MRYLYEIVTILTLVSSNLACADASPRGLSVSSTQALPMEKSCNFPPPAPRGREATANPVLYTEHSVYRDSTFLQYVYAIAYVESAFNPKAISPKQAYGLMQLTRIAMMESAAYCHIPVIRDMNRLLDPATNIKYGTCYLKFLVEAAEENYTRAVIAYNGGYRALGLYDRGVGIPNETAQYTLQVERIRRLCNSNGDGGLDGN